MTEQASFSPPDEGADLLTLRSLPVGERFAHASWDFAEARPRREFHPYPARFVSEIPRQVLGLLDVEGTVLDPFCGSGTTLAEARRAGCDAIGIDINPVACLISRVRCSPWEPGDEALGRQHARHVFEAAKDAVEVSSDHDHIPRLDHWFSPDAQHALSGAVGYARSLPLSDPWRDRVAAAISAATVRVSRQESDTRYAAVDKPGDQLSMAAQLSDAVTNVSRWLADNASDYPDGSARVLCRDARDMSELSDRSVDLVCFSPPYPNAYEYWLYHKYRMYWLGFDPVAVREQEIGARPHYSRPNGLTEHDFAAQMRDVFAGLWRVMRSGAHAVVVVGDSVIDGRHVDNGALLTEIATECGFSFETALRRPVAAKRSAFNRAHSRARRDEHILVFGRGS